MFSTHNRGYKRIHNLPWHEDTLLDPAHLRNCLSALVHWPKHLMMKQHEFYNSEYAVVNYSANEFSFRTYNIQLDAQLRQLQYTGFDNIEVYNMKREAWNVMAIFHGLITWRRKAFAQV